MPEKIARNQSQKGYQIERQKRMPDRMPEHARKNVRTDAR
jgi:hypothetical protein